MMGFLIFFLVIIRVSETWRETLFLGAVVTEKR